MSLRDLSKHRAQGSAFFGKPYRRAIIVASILGLMVVPATAAMAPIVEDGETASRVVRPHQQFLSPSDLGLLRQAFDMAERGQWDAARALASNTDSGTIRDLIEWRYLSSGSSGADFQSISRFIETHSDWAGIAALRARAEIAMPSDAMEAKDVIAWFRGAEPVSGEGFIKLGEAYMRAGDRSKGQTLIRQGWTEGDFSDDRFASIAVRYDGVLTQKDHFKRMSRLLWERKGTAASQMFSRVDAGAVALATARMRLQSGVKAADAAYQSVPGQYRQDPGLLYDRARFLRKRDRDGEARLLLIQAGSRLEGPAPVADGWWDERNVLARSALDEGQIDTAYALAAGHRIRPQDNLADFAEGEFLAGWIALQFQRKADLGLRHFKTLRQGVTAPISVARAHYWAGRALQKLGKAEEAQAEFRLGAALPLTYYGQLALNETGAKPKFSVPATPAPSGQAAFMARSSVGAIRALADLGEDRRVRAFSLALAEAISTPEEYSHLVSLLRGLGQPALAVRVAKRGLQRNLPVYDLAYPSIGLPAYAGAGTQPEKALIMGLIRQESEFDPQAVSSANARGLMQMIHGTARMTATRHSLPYGGRDNLLDPVTNLRLGVAHLGDLLGDFAGSYIMSAAAYNAGGGRVNEWVGRFGDPRMTTADPVDWIERIPFSETRNYVQRVLENTQVYRALGQGREGQAVLAQDLRRGGYANVAAAAQFSSTAPATPVPDVADMAQTAATALAASIAADPAVVAAPSATPRIAMMAPVIEEDEKPGAKPLLQIKPKSTKSTKSAKNAKAKKKGSARATASTARCKPGSKEARCRKRPS